jgi:hypothetical protein
MIRSMEGRTVDANGFRLRGREVSRLRESLQWGNDGCVRGSGIEG